MKNDNSLTLRLTDEVINPGGLISLGMEALRQESLQDIPQYNFPVVISTIARAIAGKVEYERVSPNFFMLKIGGIASGKSSVDNLISEKIDFEKFYGPQSFASSQALLKYLTIQPQTLLNIDEASRMFRRFHNGDIVIADALFEVYNNTGLRYKKTYARNSFTIKSPCINVLGNARPEIIDFSSRLIQHFTLFYYGGDMLDIEELEGENAKMDEFVEKIRELYGEKVIVEPEELKMSSAGFERLQEFSSMLVDTVNAEEKDQFKGIISRKYNEAIKYAMVLNAGKKKIDLKAIEYGINVANILGDWKLDVINRKVC